MFKPSSIEVTAMIPRDVRRVDFGDFSVFSAIFSKAVAPPEVKIRLIIPPIKAMTSTVNTLSMSAIVSSTASVKPAKSPALYTRIAARIPDTKRDSIVRFVIST